ncbi:hypothetical protein PF005_g7142 [Phytophthora fragariae]|uniref:Uncharacterized protein n=1 Tax=Phytophthora fragariae TaxID=53985 RepID=A0A6A3UII3_9STRA|nr:hypothetical protein PF003_g24894 [Phytophthora fragariae]KAE9019400.1 hypothetical protein PF011_g5843 [Phytophthora fragariae]KAE9125703.1 hypothetical protein PF010_g5528 [Phytophthora fragariae]KAE9149959.1 hypothetical protein PF006_g5611 [Phytophthora fragariae]KAE9221326.1 hypothetical protein PF005_g7142 [Phytophthora fragariae]
MELPQLRFQVYHKAESSMGHVNGLSRVYSDTVCAVSMYDLLNDADLDEQSTPLVGKGPAADPSDLGPPSAGTRHGEHGSVAVGEHGPLEGDAAKPSPTRADLPPSDPYESIATPTNQLL